jgi:SAM-dependent methyltransferase
MNVFYETLAPFWPLLSPVEDYEEEAGELRRILEEAAPSGRSLLELGSGGGHVAHHLTARFTITLTDVSAGMLAMSRRINPECEHILGDMRTLSLARTFDAVLAHDAIDYMTTEDDLLAALTTAHRHLVPGGVALFAPDHVLERFVPSSDAGGDDAPDGRGIRYLEWTLPLGPGETVGVTHYSFLVREPGQPVRSFYEAHPFGAHPVATWLRLFERVGFAVEPIEERTGEDRPPRLFFLGRKTALE